MNKEKSLIEFNPEDVRVLAETVLWNWEHENHNSRYHCRYCSGEFNRCKDQNHPDYKYPHKTNCPVHVANDVLTKA